MEIRRINAAGDGRIGVEIVGAGYDGKQERRTHGATRRSVERPIDDRAFIGNLTQHAHQLPVGVLDPLGPGLTAARLENREQRIEIRAELGEQALVVALIDGVAPEERPKQRVDVPDLMRD